MTDLSWLEPTLKAAGPYSWIVVVAAVVYFAAREYRKARSESVTEFRLEAAEARKEKMELEQATRGQITTLEGEVKELREKLDAATEKHSEDLRVAATAYNLKVDSFQAEMRTKFDQITVAHEKREDEVRDKMQKRINDANREKEYEIYCNTIYREELLRKNVTISSLGIISFEQWRVTNTA